MEKENKVTNGDKRPRVAEVVMTLVIIMLIIIGLTLKFGVGILFTPREDNIRDNKDEVLVAYNVDVVLPNPILNDNIGR